MQSDRPPELYNLPSLARLRKNPSLQQVGYRQGQDQLSSGNRFAASPAAIGIHGMRQQPNANSNVNINYRSEMQMK